MGTIVRRNERSWAIVIISEIRVMLNSLNLKIKSAGGESTLSVNKKSMFPDVLLYEGEAQTKILQGWELKMPDVLITDEALIADATRKAKALGLNSFVIWNFTYGKLYVETEEGRFEEAKAWTGTSHIKKREDVMTYKNEWLPVVKEIVLTVNEYLVNGKISAAPIITTISDGLITEVIQRNKELVAENILIEAQKSMPMESRIKVWWNAFKEEYDKDESNMYSAYAKSILLNWTNRITFANAIKKYHNCAYAIKDIDNTTSPEDGNIIIDKIVEQGDFYNVFKKIEFNEVIPEDTWIDIVDYNQFLVVELLVNAYEEGVHKEVLPFVESSLKNEKDCCIDKLDTILEIMDSIEDSEKMRLANGYGALVLKTDNEEVIFEKYLKNYSESLECLVGYLVGGLYPSKEVIAKKWLSIFMGEEKPYCKKAGIHLLRRSLNYNTTIFEDYFAVLEQLSENQEYWEQLIGVYIQYIENESNVLYRNKVKERLIRVKDGSLKEKRICVQEIDYRIKRVNEYSEIIEKILEKSFDKDRLILESIDYYVDYMLDENLISGELIKLPHRLNIPLQATNSGSQFCIQTWFFSGKPCKICNIRRLVQTNRSIAFLTVKRDADIFVEADLNTVGFWVMHCKNYFSHK